MENNLSVSPSYNLSVIIVNWNTGQLLSDCLMALFSETKDINTRVIVVDNHSSDESVTLAKQLFPNLNYIENNFNGGFAKANNQGLQLVTGNFVLFLNPDTKVQNGSIQRLIQFLEQNPDVGVAGGRLVYPDGRPQISYYKYPTLNSFKYFVANYYLNKNSGVRKNNKLELRWADRLNRWGYLNWQPLTMEDMNISAISNKPFEIDYPVGACFLVRWELIEKIKGFDEQFFLYGEETDFCLRAKQQDWKIFTIPDATIIHYAGVSTGKVSERRFQIWSRSQFLYMKKHYGWMTALKTKFLLYRFKNVFIDLINSISLGNQKTPPNS